MRTDGIRPCARNPMYWQYRGMPVLLLGATDDDNLFQWPADRLVAHLDLLKSVGGNYIRNTMSTRHSAFPYNDDGMAYAFRRRADGKYDLDEFNTEYWDRLERLLRETEARGIIVQNELWDAGTFGRNGGWELQPWNPDNNVSYTYEGTTLERAWVWRDGNPFFSAVPALNNDAVLMRYQNAYMARMLDLCLTYDHVLYQINNESRLPYAVSDYWATFIHRRAQERGRTVHVCDSRNMHDEDSELGFCRAESADHAHTLSHPDLYTYADISQNGGNTGQAHYDNLLWFRGQVQQSTPRPVNHTKVYFFVWPTGAHWKDASAGSEQIATERFWRTVFGGGASVRFHRQKDGPPWLDGRGGVGLSPCGQAHVRSARMFSDALDVVSMAPSPDLLRGRTENEAYCLAESGRQFGVYFTGEGDRRVELDLGSAPGTLEARWLDIGESKWSAPIEARGGGALPLAAPGPGQWAVALRARGVAGEV
ncbi:MAG: hypothetical protein JXR37_20685 [Kiritimatiellae bacterium]|nr:hypothetical protein [Kiritimatiellia bacterium]